MKKTTNKKNEWVNDDFGHHYLGETNYQGKSRFQKIEIFKNPTFGNMLFLDGKIQLSEKDENRYHQYLVAAPLLIHPKPKRVGIIGGGDCFALEEAVKHPNLQEIIMLELDDGVVNFCTRFFPKIKQARQDRRVQLHFTDARKWLSEHAVKFDVLIIDLTEPHGPSKMLYTKEFYQLCQSRLTSRGLVSIHSDNYALFPEAYATIYHTLHHVFPNILTAKVEMPCFGMEWTYRLASCGPLSIAGLIKRTKTFELQHQPLDQFTPTSYLVEPTGEEKKILKKYNKVSSDRQPYDKFEKLTGKVTR